MSKTVIYDHRIDVTEQIVLSGLFRSFNPDSKEGEIIAVCHDIYKKKASERQTFRKLEKYYNDDQKDIFVRDVFKPLLGKTPSGEYVYDVLCRENVSPIIKISNYTKRFVDKQSTLYDEAPEREVQGDEKATEEYRRLCKDIRLDAIMQMAERYQKLFQSSFLRPVIREIDGEQVIDVDLLTPVFLYAVPCAEDSTRAQAYFWISYDPRHPESEYRATWYYIDKTRFFWWSWEDQDVLASSVGTEKSAVISENVSLDEETGEQESQGNTLGEMGIVRLATSWVGSEVIPRPGDSLLNFQDSVNLVETMSHNSLIFQAFPLLHLHNFDIKDKDGQVKRINIGPWNTLITSGISGDAEAKVEWVAPQTNIDPFIKTLEHDIDTFLLTSGVPKNLILDSSTSGAALAERNRDIQEIRKSYVNQYSSVEAELYRILAKWCARWSKEYALPEDGVLLITYPTIDVPDISTHESEAKRLEVIAKKIELGIISRKEAYLEEHPEMSEEDAEKELAKIDSERQSTIFSPVSSQAKGAIANAVSILRNE
jgi:hypothetical protein